VLIEPLVQMCKVDGASRRQLAWMIDYGQAPDFADNTVVYGQGHSRLPVAGMTPVEFGVVGQAMEPPKYGTMFDLSEFREDQFT
jgi:hypothetical protein